MPTEGFIPFDDNGGDSSIRGLVAGLKVLKRYTLKRVLGRGGMGVVWLVRDDELERDIAFKFLPDIVYHDKAAVESLKRETRRSLELTHPNIVRIYDFAQDEHCAGISMEYVAGDTLSNLRACRPNHVFEVSEVIQWTKQLCQALEYAHKEAKVAHRDLKPANLMLNNRGQLKVADFGISRSISDNMTRVSSAVHGASGTLVYMSPQQAMGEAASALDDIYSFGATLFELLTSKPPFFTGEIMAQLREKVPPTMAERRKQLGIEGKPIPPEWEETVAACLSKDPTKRPQSAQEVLQRLGLAETAGLEAESLTTTKVSDASAPAPSPSTTAAKSLMDLAPAVPPPAHEEHQTTAKVHLPPQEFVLDSKGFKPVPPAPPKTTRPLRVVRRWLVAALLALVLGAIWFTYWLGHPGERLSPGMGGVELRTTPAGAVVKLSNGKILKSPARFIDLPPGSYEAQIELADHDVQTVKVEVKEGVIVETQPLQLKPHLGRVILASDPAGATFKVNGKALSAAEKKTLIAELRPGNYEITAEYPGWAPLKKQVTVKKDAELKEVFAFRPGLVEITSEPSGAKVMAGNKELGVTPLALPDIQPGEVLYVLLKDDFNPEVVKGEVMAGQKLSLNKQLTKERGTLVLSSPMPGVDFYLDGIPLGQLITGQKFQTNVSPGKHEITAVMAGWPKQEKQVVVARDKVSALQFDFTLAAVLVASDPPGATVTIGATNVGVTPFTIRAVRPGPFNVLVQMDGFDPVTVDTNVLSGETLPLRVTLPRMTRPIRFKTEPADALVSLDGIWLTNKPPRFAVGKHTMRVERDGYEAREMEVEIKADGANDLGAIALLRTSGNLRVLSLPPNATFEVFTEGKNRVAKTGEELSGIPTGKQRVLVKADGYEPRYVDVEVLKDQTVVTEAITLARSKGNMRVLSNPAGAGYSLTGPDGVMRSGKTPADEMQLPTGNYQVTFTYAGYETTNLTVVVNTQGSAAAEVSLRRSQGGLRLTVNQPGASFALNGPDGYYKEGVLPLPPTTLPTGKYTVEVTLEGYDALKQEIDVSAMESRAVALNLIRSKGVLLANIQPVEAMAEIKGAGLTKPVLSGRRLEGLPTGNYTLVARYKNWSITNQLTIRRNETTETTALLPFGSIRFESEPAGATVMRDAEELGVTPFTLNELPLGGAKFQLRLPRHRFEDIAVPVQAQQQEIVKRKLEPYAGPQPGMREWVNSLGMRFVPVGNLWVCVWETRVKDFTKFYDATRYNAGVGWREPGFPQTPSHPVVEVSWNDAQAFCRWLTDKEGKDKFLEQAAYRLPTQAEWQQLLRASYTTGQYLWGDTWPLPSETANLADNLSYDRNAFTAPVGSYRPTKSGIFDLVGNVWEWCADSAGPAKERTVLGESWLQYPGSNLSLQDRRSLDVGDRGRDVGFRIVLAPVPLN
jgi:serine/threonine protein kinase